MSIYGSTAYNTQQYNAAPVSSTPSFWTTETLSLLGTWTVQSAAGSFSWTVEPVTQGTVWTSLL